MTIRKGRAFRLIPGGSLGTNQVRWTLIRKNPPGHRVPGMCKGKKLSEIQEVATNLRIPLRTRRDGKGKLVPKRKAQLCAAIRREVGGNTTVIREQLKKLNRKVKKPRKVRSNKGVKRGPRGSKATNINNVPLSKLIETINAEAPKKPRKVRSNKGVKRGPRGSKKPNNIPMNKLIETISNSNSNNDFYVENARKNKNKNALMVAVPKRITPVRVNAKKNQNKNNNSRQTVNWNAAFAKTKNKKMTNKEIEELTAQVRNAQNKRWNNMIARIEAREKAKKPVKGRRSP